jgi:hypothetical protein
VESVVPAAGAPLPDPPPQTAWGRENGGVSAGFAMQFSPSPRGTSGEGAGGRGPRGRSVMSFAEPRSVGGPRVQRDVFRRASIRRQPQPPPGFFGGGGRGLRARWGRSPARGTLRRVSMPFSPSPRGTSGEGAGGRGPRGRSVMSFAEPRSVGTPRAQCDALRRGPTRDRTAPTPPCRLRMIFAILDSPRASRPRGEPEGP